MDSMLKTKAEPKSKQEQAAETRERLLDAACLIFDKKGYAATTLDMVAKAAKVTRGAVYWHFENKRDLFMALHDRLHLDFVQRALADLAQEDKDPLLQLSELTIRDLEALATSEQQRLKYRILIQTTDYADDADEFQQIHNESVDQCEDLLMQYFTRAQARGQISETKDCRMLATMCCCFFMGVLHEYLRNPRGMDLEKLARPMTEQFMRGLTK